MHYRQDEEAALMPWLRPEADRLPSPRAVSQVTRFYEEDAAYRAEARIAAGGRMAHRAAEELIELDAYIARRTQGKPHLEMMLRRYLHEALGYCSGELIARYMNRP
ncbi:hypothetical protein [Actinomadura decatromicini]|uniref:Uncharacterized protein n=1 Tax=Actinomadura decatromicini TaxID=2604572 RepID=A0A5D3F919_9ACTN|nr:hypothetical protein [Actinomadura decatromicini]TYK44572.1 hypothetical protein FXF68_34505 [Actinomadura decatromicini]